MLFSDDTHLVVLVLVLLQGIVTMATVGVLVWVDMLTERIRKLEAKENNDAAH